MGSADEDGLFRLRVVLRFGVLNVQVRVLDDDEVEGLDVLGGRCDAHLHLAHAVAGVGGEVANEFRGNRRGVAGRKLVGGGADLQVVGVVGVAILQIDVPTVGGREREGVGRLVGIEVERVCVEIAEGEQVVFLLFVEVARGEGEQGDERCKEGEECFGHGVRGVFRTGRGLSIRVRGRLRRTSAALVDFGRPFVCAVRPVEGAPALISFSCRVG